ncbi:hypothetical protein BDA96_06G060800 [Sorghum bicolor]|uniref:Uncharacterized protein n=2 Tax=Sorghum bicolor TaxID=4558 RepID=A0A921UBG4_SORBI|nr:hypothetical protein BDA96_06G060800 [Sorghum bicolor]KAG0525489.1 hypothetical protein BDA96_06G060800 [Sorghum bicolor]KXG26127.1 hypothetical protein SORBI_3006G054100 [Sorghum bicolor]
MLWRCHCERAELDGDREREGGSRGAEVETRDDPWHLVDDPWHLVKYKFKYNDSAHFTCVIDLYFIIK